MSGSTTLERKLEKRFREGVESTGHRSIKCAPIEKGTPDRLVYGPTGYQFVELKTEEGRVSPAQRAWHSRAAGVGATVIVLYGERGVDGYVQNLHTMMRERD